MLLLLLLLLLLICASLVVVPRPACCYCVGAFAFSQQRRHRHHVPASAPSSSLRRSSETALPLSGGGRRAGQPPPTRTSATTSAVVEEEVWSVVDTVRSDDDDATTHGGGFFDNVYNHEDTEYSSVDNYDIDSSVLRRRVRAAAAQAIEERGHFCLGVGLCGAVRSDENAIFDSLATLLEGACNDDDDDTWWTRKTTMIFATQQQRRMIDDSSYSSAAERGDEAEKDLLVSRIQQNWKGTKVLSVSAPPLTTTAAAQQQHALWCSENVRLLRSLPTKVLPRLGNSGHTDTDLPVADLIVLATNGAEQQHVRDDDVQLYPIEPPIEDQPGERPKKRRKKKKKKKQQVPWVVPASNGITWSFPVFRAAKQVVVVAIEQNLVVENGRSSIDGDGDGNGDCYYNKYNYYADESTVTSTRSLCRPTIRQDLLDAVWIPVSRRRTARDTHQRVVAHDESSHGTAFVSSSMQRFYENSLSSVASATTGTMMFPTQSYLDSLASFINEHDSDDEPQLSFREDAATTSSIAPTTTPREGEMRMTFEEFCARHGQGF